MLDLRGKIVFISGASSGIGAATAQAFASLGCRLILCARRVDRLQSLPLNIPPSEKLLFELDVTRKNEVFQTIEQLRPEWRSIDILVNNAGLAVGRDPLYGAEIDDWERMIDTNVKGLLYVTRAILPGMVERNSGHVINIGSIAGHQTYPGGAVYCATKHAVRAINETLKSDLLGTNVRTSSVDPGMVETEFSVVRFKGDKQRADAVYAGVAPLTAEDVADAIVYCASRPLHVNINEILLQSRDQSGATMIHRKT